MASHLRKKQFQSSSQPSITSYFDRSATAANNDNPAFVRALSPLQPAVPATVQSSLLNVGMRVRKSVPEGYKTHKTMPAYHMPCLADQSTARPPPSSAPAFIDTRSTSSRELLPFCGLHAVGGIPASQQESVPSLSSVPSLVNSQNSIASSFYQPRDDMGLKRSYTDDIEDEMDDYFDHDDDDDQAMTVEPRLVQPSRLFATPTSRLKGIESAVPGDFTDTDVPFLQVVG